MDTPNTQDGPRPNRALRAHQLQQFSAFLEEVERLYSTYFLKSETPPFYEIPKVWKSLMSLWQQCRDVAPVMCRIVDSSVEVISEFKYEHDEAEAQQQAVEHDGTKYSNQITDRED